eukprot:scaffold225092_cov22-Tisochrysis_lutea.AAC.1
MDEKERAESVRHCKYVWSKCRIRHSWEAACCIHTLHMINKACNICAKHRGNGKPTMANRCISMQRGLFVDSVLSMHLCTLCKKFASNVKVHHVSMPARGTPSLPALLFVNEETRPFTCQQLPCCRWVDEVVEQAPWVINLEFLDKHKIDYGGVSELAHCRGRRCSPPCRCPKAGMQYATRTAQSLCHKPRASFKLHYIWLHVA